MSKKQVSKSYVDFLQEIKSRIRTAQYEALRTVNRELITLYWDIGKMIVKRQERHGWGKSIVESLGQDLQKEFPGTKGFSVQNLWYMRQFYLEYHKSSNLQPLVGEIAWSHNLIIMSRCKDDLEREFYIRMTRRMGWTKNVLIHHIEDKSYEKTLANQTSFDKALPQKIKNQAKLAVRDEYTFGFLGLEDEHAERELETALVKKVTLFLREMGGMFAFVGNQFRLEIDGNEFFIDILLYHRRLKSLVAIELKVGAFQPEFVGKMQFYLAVLDDRVRLRGENASIGIILCKEKSRVIVEYALKESRKPIGIAQYKIVDKVPKELKKELPAPEQIKSLLEDLT